MPTWNRIQDERAGYIYDLSESLALVDWRNPNVLQPVSNGTLVITSDYSGQHKGASHDAYSFLVTTDRALGEWQRVLEQFRHQWLPDGRRMSFKRLFKRLGDGMRWRALRPFLEIASTIRGNVITFLVDRRIGSFIAGGPSTISEAFPDCFEPGTKPGTMEKMLRLASFLAMLTAGLRKEDQRSIWVSDHDEALDSFDRREGFARLASYLSFGFARWTNPADSEFVTTELAHAPQWAEDATAIPDLVAGACCQLAAVLPTFVGTEVWKRVVTTEKVEDRRARAVGGWMATNAGQLRHAILRLELDRDGKQRSSAQFFVGATPSRSLVI
jgi:hypothetical protein